MHARAFAFAVRASLTHASRRTRVLSRCQAQNSMDDEQLKAVRTEAAARHAAAAVASAAHAPQAQAVRTCEESQAGVHSVGAAPPRVPEVPPPADSDDDEVVITGEVPASKPSAQALRAAEDDDLASAALARALEREQANEAQKGKRPRVEPQPQRAPAFADGLGFKLSAIRDVQPGDLLTNRNAISLRDIFRVPGNIRWCLASNYLWNLQWLSVALPELFQVPKVFAVMDRRNSDEATIQAAKALGWTVHAPYTPQYGVMHTKLFLIHFQYAQGRQWLRVVVHTFEPACSSGGYRAVKSTASLVILLSVEDALRPATQPAACSTDGQTEPSFEPLGLCLKGVLADLQTLPFRLFKMAVEFFKCLFQRSS